MTEAASRISFDELLDRKAFEELESAWVDELAAPGPIERYLAAIERLLGLREAERAGVLAAMLAEALAEQSDRTGELWELLDRLAELGLPDLPGGEALLSRRLDEGCVDDPWFPYLKRKAGIDQALDWRSFVRFRRYQAFVPGRVVLHGSGWGTGLIEAIDEDQDELRIRFQSGAVRSIPWRSALETMEPLPPDDLRALELTDREQLASLVEQDPGEVLRRALRVYRGRATSAQLRDLLRERIVPLRRWTTWWRKAKNAAIDDPRIAVEGSPTRPVFRLRKRALTLLEELAEKVKHSGGITETIALFRDYHGRAAGGEDAERVARLAEERLAHWTGRRPPDAESIAAIAFLVEIGKLTRETWEAALREWLGDDWRLERLAQIDDKHTRVEIARLLPDLVGSDWPARLIGQLAAVPETCEDVLETLVNAASEEGAGAELAALFVRLAAFPQQHPFLLYLLVRAYASGALPADAIDPNVVCRVTLHVLRLVGEGRARTSGMTRLQNRITTVLLGRRRLLDDLVEAVDEDTFRSMRRVMRTGADALPAGVLETIERAGRRRFPELFREAAERPIWEDPDVILTTRAGLEAREREFLEIRDVKIPENSRQIGAAASMGDLSENAEWEAALEEQRNLTARAAELEEELKRARPIEELDTSGDRVVPGTRVTFEDVETGRSRSVRILGPWDGVLGPDVVSYRAPLAAALLGRRPRDVVEVELPNERLRVRIVAVEPLFG